VSCSKLEDRRKTMSVARGTRNVLNPRLARPASACEWSGVATPKLFPGELLGKLHDQSVLDETDKHLPASVAGRKTEHTTSSKAAVMFDEIRKKRLKIGSKRNRHADEAIVSYCFSFCSSLRFRSVPQR
jgi:hypothetical protein